MSERIRTDKQVVLEAANALCRSILLETNPDLDNQAYNQACKEMVEALRYAQSIEFWDQFNG
jgi:hypothetical protein